MPTTSQYQILQQLLESDDINDEEKSLISKLESFHDKNDDEDAFYTPELKEKLTEVRDNLNKSVQNTDDRQSNPTLAVVPSLPKDIRNNLYRLGFRNQQSETKSKLIQIVEETMTTATNSTNPSSTKQSAKIVIPKAAGSDTKVVMRNKEDRVPESRPRSVCFNYPGPELTHLEVKRALDRLLVALPDVKLDTIEFQPRCKLVCHDKTENICRWIITVKTEWETRRLANKECIIRGEKIALKRYDELVHLEMINHDKMLALMDIINST